MTDLLELWNLKVVKEGSKIEIHYSPLKFRIDVSEKHGYILLEGRRLGKVRK